MIVGRRLPAEWEPQDFVMLALPHAQTDWCYMLDEVISCYTHIISTILRYQNVVLLCNDTVEARKRLAQEIYRHLEGRQRPQAGLEPAHYRLEGCCSIH